MPAQDLKQRLHPGSLALSQPRGRPSRRSQGTALAHGPRGLPETEGSFRRNNATSQRMQTCLPSLRPGALVPRGGVLRLCRALLFLCLLRFSRRGGRKGVQVSFSYVQIRKETKVRRAVLKRGRWFVSKVPRGEQTVSVVRVWFIGAARYSCTGTVIVSCSVSMPGFMVHAQWFMHFMHSLYQRSAGRTERSCQLRSCAGSCGSWAHERDDGLY